MKDLNMRTMGAFADGACTLDTGHRRVKRCEPRSVHATTTAARADDPGTGEAKQRDTDADGSGDHSGPAGNAAHQRDCAGRV